MSESTYSSDARTDTTSQRQDMFFRYLSLLVLSSEVYIRPLLSHSGSLILSLQHCDLYQPGSNELHQTHLLLEFTTL
jgi:hypothetical protein